MSEFTDKQKQEAYDDQMIKEGFKKIRANLGNGRSAIRYLPEKYLLRTDERLCEIREPVIREFYK